MITGNIGVKEVISMKKSRYSYYAAYGKNRTGIYTNFNALESQQKFYKGLKYKGFYFIDEALEFIAAGICNDYKICEPQQIDVTVLAEKKNFTFNIDALIRTDGLCMSN